MNKSSAASTLAMMAAMGGVPLTSDKKVKEPRLPLTDEELEKLHSFDLNAKDKGERRANRLAKRAYLEELRAKYAPKPAAKEDLGPSKLALGPDAFDANAGSVPGEEDPQAANAAGDERPGDGHHSEPGVPGVAST